MKPTFVLLQKLGIQNTTPIAAGLNVKSGCKYSA
jgi:hypothetical protein